MKEVLEAQVRRCAISGCNGISFARGVCEKCYHRQRWPEQKGRILNSRPPRYESLRFHIRRLIEMGKEPNWSNVTKEWGRKLSTFENAWRKQIIQEERFTTADSPPTTQPKDIL